MFSLAYNKYTKLTNQKTAGIRQFSGFCLTQFSSADFSIIRPPLIGIFNGQDPVTLLNQGFHDAKIIFAEKH
jgi:hypothetical protein